MAPAPYTLSPVAKDDVSSISERDRRDAQVANVLARAVRDGEVEAVDALRILKHELRTRNTKKAQKIATRSQEAQRVMDLYGSKSVPTNSSLDALHADHVYPLTVADLRRNHTVDMWIDTLRRVRTVVCVTAAENYRLEILERAGTAGVEKYAAAGVVFTTNKLPWGSGP